MKINVILAKRDRDFQYRIFLHYLNEISKGHDVSLYTTTSRDELTYETQYLIEFDNLRIEHFYLHSDDKVFNKSKLLNNSLSIMRQNYDCVCVFDIDMIYSEGFFSCIENNFSNGMDYIVSYGKSLDEATTNFVCESPYPSLVEISRLTGTERMGCSQIAMNRKVLSIFKQLFDSVYDEGYENWGGEDSDLSFKSKHLERMGIIKKKSLYNIWTHLYHETRKPELYRIADVNSKKFQNSKEVIERKIMTNYYCNSLY